MDNVTQLWGFRLTSLVGIASASIFCTSSKWSLYPLLFRLWFSLSFLRSVKKLMACLAWQFPASSSANIIHYTWGYVEVWSSLMIWLLNFKYLLFPSISHPTYFYLPAFHMFWGILWAAATAHLEHPLGPGRAGPTDWGGGDYQKYYQKYMDSYGSGGGGGYEKYMSEPSLKRPCYTSLRFTVGPGFTTTKV